VVDGASLRSNRHLFVEGRVLLGFAFVGLTAASGGLWVYRYRGGR
jgi:hypothetical protein